MLHAERRSSRAETQPIERLRCNVAYEAGNCKKVCIEAEITKEISRESEGEEEEVESP